MRTHSLRLLAAIAALASLAACVPSPTAATAATAGTLDESSTPGIERAPSRDVTAPPDSTDCTPLDATDTCHAIQPWY